uniref:[histone H4]-lysine(20) N-methyltransferase n=1 Tax=Caenorhabditis tropicalis TaxID=1561998 RepID=A0A1I7UAL8_9PELO
MKRGGRKGNKNRSIARNTTSPLASDIENGAFGRQTPAVETPKPIKKRTPKKAQFRLTDYYGVRKSGRKTVNQLKEEADRDLYMKIINHETEHKLDIYIDPVKGRGCRANINFHKGDYVVEYKGNMIPYSTAKKTESEYKLNDDIGSFMYFFEFHGKKWCVDATEETEFKGRLINHSLLKPNLKTKVVEFNGKHFLIFVALRDIVSGEELLYDYGDRSSEAAEDHPWLINS